MNPPKANCEVQQKKTEEDRWLKAFDYFGSLSENNQAKNEVYTFAEVNKIQSTECRAEDESSPLEFRLRKQIEAAPSRYNFDSGVNK